MNPKISVIMSVYNGEQYLDKGITSILNQTFSDFEFIICDDCSNDNTLDLLNKFAQIDKRIIVIHNEKNMGLAYSLNRCIELSKCDILARQDADDESALNRFEIQFPFVLNHPEYAIVGTSWYSVNGTSKNLVNPIEIPTAKQMLWGGSYMHPSWMMRKEALKKVNYYTATDLTRRDQDYHLVMKLLGIGLKIYNLQTPLYFYTADEGAFKRTKSWKRVKGLMWIRFDSYKRNKFPFWYYVAVLKPFIKMLMPNFISKWIYNRKMNNEKK